MLKIYIFYCKGKCVIFICIYIRIENINKMDKMRMKSTSKDSSKSARTTKSASASHSSPVSKSIVKNFMKGLMTTEELLKKKRK